ncbi:LacI family transcriptional regulator [Candidatus Magnetomorum sp. HK-1]|nr:LacI family transcriptional regulator [Candidatus Magnetomorum sp. HK-1]
MNSLVGMIIPDGMNQFFSALALQTQRQLANMGIPMVVLNSDNSPDNEIQGVDLLLKKMNVEGIIFVSVGDNEEVYHQLRESNIPIVIVDREIPETENCDFVISNNKVGIIEAVKYLVTLGHKKLGILKGLQNTDPGRIRYKAFLEAMDECELKHDPRLEFDGEFDFLSGTKAAEEIYNLSKGKRPTAVISCNDFMAFGLLQGLARLEINVPNDISIIGVDDIPLCEWSNPKLTTIRQDTTQIAIWAAKYLVSRIAGECSDTPRLEWVEPRLIKRESVKIFGNKI